uniref:Vitamin K epoxide reductase complex subunit 1 n=1 Tax=Nomascus leucogenys TaxID=61853 RepID=A0A2I3GC15_NOMLE
MIILESGIGVPGERTRGWTARGVVAQGLSYPEILVFEISVRGRGPDSVGDWDYSGSSHANWMPRNNGDRERRGGRMEAEIDDGLKDGAQVGQGLRAGGACAGTGQYPQSIQQHIRLHLLHTTAIVRLPADTLGLCPAAAELPGVSRWFCLPGLDPVLRAL